MKLERFGTQLDDYVNGTLDEPGRREIEAFLAGSPEARLELADYRRMVHQLAELPEAIEPQRNLLPDIETQLERATRRRGLRRRGLAVAATLAAALGLAYLTTRVMGPAAAPAVPPSAPPPATVASQTTAHTATSLAERELVAATERLKLALDENRAALPPETRRLVARNLRIIQGAIDEIQIALDRDPGNQELNRVLVGYYQHELAMLQRVNRAASRM